MKNPFVNMNGPTGFLRIPIESAKRMWAHTNLDRVLRPNILPILEQRKFNRLPRNGIYPGKP